MVEPMTSADQEAICILGTYLGILPFADEHGTITRRAVVRSHRGLLAFRESRSVALNHLRRARSSHGFAQWCAVRDVDPLELLEELETDGAVVRMPVDPDEDFHRRHRLESVGESYGIDDTGRYVLVSPDGDVIPVSESTYWLWAFASGRRHVVDAARFVLETAFAAGNSGDLTEILDGAHFLVLAGLAHLDLAVD